MTTYHLSDAEERIVYLGLLVVLKKIEKAQDQPLLVEILLREYRAVGIFSLQDLKDRTEQLKAKFETSTPVFN